MIKRYIIICLIVLILVACSAAEPEPTATPLPPTDTPEPTVTPTFTPVPSPTPTPTLTPTPGPLSSSEIFDTVSPSIAYIQLPGKSGSGVLIDDGYIVTNAHVVWPFQKARVVFPDKSEFLEVPVVRLDMMADLAVLGPVEVDAEPLPLIDGEDLVIGTDVYLIGYPGEREEFPQPTVTRGLISRVREWAFPEISYFQTDADIAGGQSGGVLVSEMGDVIGISGFSFTEAGFGLVASAGDINSRIETLVDGENVDDLGDRRIPLEGGRPSHTVILSNPYETQVFIIDEPVGTEVDIELFGVNTGGFSLYDPYGNPLIDQKTEASETSKETVEIETEGPHFLVVFHTGAYRSTFTISSSHNLIKYDNPEEDLYNFVSSPIALGHISEREGSIDYPGDIDTYELTLKEGDEVTIRVDSVMIDPFLGIIFPGGGYDDYVSDDDSGGGLFGMSSELTYRAPHDATFLLFVEDAYGSQIGGYVLTVEEPYEGAPTPVAIAPTAVPYDSPFGPMALYESPDYPFTMQYPAEWREFYEPTVGILEEHCTFTQCYHSYDGNSLQLVEFDMEEYIGMDLSLNQFSQAIGRVYAEQGRTVISQQWIVTEQGLNGIVIKSRDVLFEDVILLEFVTIDDGIMFNALYFVSEDNLPALEEMIRYTFSTFEVTSE